MGLLIKNAYVYSCGRLTVQDIRIDNGTVVRIAPTLPAFESDVVIKLNNYFVFPGFVDVHIHLREPGFSYKETIYDGSLAAAHGGFTSVCAMPNLNPVPDCAENIELELDIIKRTANVNVYPYAAITRGQKGEELADMDKLADLSIAFSDDGKGIQSEGMMRKAMLIAKAKGKIIAAHCEDDRLLNGGYIHQGEYALKHNHKGICSESEWKPLERDLALAKETGCAYHVCHVSTKESVALIRKAKSEGVDVTCETAPHYLVLSDMMLEDDGRFKMNPPVRAEEDRLALIEGIRDGAIDMIATDHAPHSEEEKSRGLAGSVMGITGLETAFPVLYTELVKKGVISLDKLLELMVTNPSRRFGIGGELLEGAKADITVFDLDNKYVINSADFLSKGKSTPFDGKEVYGKCKMTIVNGRIIWQENLTEK